MISNAKVSTNFRDLSHSVDNAEKGKIFTSPDKKDSAGSLKHKLLAGGLTFATIFFGAIAYQKLEKIVLQRRQTDIDISCKCDEQQKPQFLFAGQSNMVGRSNDAKEGLFDELIDILNSGESKFKIIENLEIAIGASNGATQNSIKNEARILYDMRSLLEENVIKNAMEKVSCSFFDPKEPQVCGCEQDLTPYTCGRDDYGPELMFGHRFSKLDTMYQGQEISITKVAAGGTKIYKNWSKSNAGSPQNYWKNLANTIKAAKGSMKAFVWFQGEADCREAEDRESYLENLTQFVSDVRSEIYKTSLSFGSPDDVPVVIVELGRWVYDINTTVLEAQRTFVNNTPNTMLVSTGSTDIDTEKLTKNLHFDAAAYLIIGDRIAKVLASLLNSNRSLSSSFT